MKHKPQSLFSTSKRLASEWKTMTIIAGFRSGGGIVLCADTQETVGDISKRNVPKLRIEPSGMEFATWPLRSAHDIAIAFCGATNNGPFMDEIVDRAWNDVKDATSLDEASRLVNQSIKDSYREFGGIYQAGYLPSTELIYGIKMHGQSKLFYALGPAVNEKDAYATGGIGCYMADFLASRMYKNALNLRQCAILAAYILFQAKEHVEGCGGESHIAILRNDGSSGRLDWHRVEALTKLLQQADSEIGGLLIRYADLPVKSEEFRESAAKTLDLLVHVRESEIETAKKWEDFWERIVGMGIDDVGLPRLTGDVSAE